MSKATKLIRFAALRRVSTEQQLKTGESLQTQTDEISQRVKELGGEIVEWYGGQEHATPGHEKKEIGRLLSDAQKGRFEAVICAHPDRWSRDNSASREGLEIFRSNGIRFFASGSEYNLFDATHEMYLGISAVIGQFHARNQAHKSLINRIARAKRGVPSTGKIPFGRIFVRGKDRQSGEWKVDESKKAMIEDCAQRYLRGESVQSLADEYGMNASNLHKVLTQRAGSKWEVFFEAKNLNIKQTVEITIPPLLSDKTIKAIQAKCAANRTFSHGEIKHRYLLSRMIFCAHCGYTMFGQTNHGNRRYYRHAHARRVKPCTVEKLWVPAELIEDNVMRHLFETFGNPSAVEKAIERATPTNERIEYATQRREQLLREIEKVKAGRQRIISLIAKGTLSENDAEQELAKLKSREHKLENEQGRIDDELSHIPSPKLVKVFASRVTKAFHPYANAWVAAKKRHANTAFEAMTWEERRQLCETVFNGMTPDGARMGVFVSWPNGPKNWRYRIEGNLIDAEGRLPAKAFTFGAPHAQKEIVTKSALHYISRAPPSPRSSAPTPPPCA